LEAEQFLFSAIRREGIERLMKKSSAERLMNNHGEFDPGSERTLAARLKHASRTARKMLASSPEWRTGE
jgi:hypothetical protein